MIHANLAIARQGRLDGVAPRTEIADCEILEFYRHIDGNNLLECAPPNSASDFRGPGRTCPPPQPSHQPSAEESNSSLQPNESDGGGGKYSISTSFLVSPFFFFFPPSLSHIIFTRHELNIARFMSWWQIGPFLARLVNMSPFRVMVVAYED